MTRGLLLFLAPLLCAADFGPPDFLARRAQVFDQIGHRAVAVVQAAALPEGFGVFRQANDFYYLTGLEVPHAYLLLDGRTRRATAFLPHRNVARDNNQGKVLAPEDAEEVKQVSGVDAVLGVEALAPQLASMQIRLPAPVLYVPSSPLQGVMGSRDELLKAAAEVASDPWDGRPTRSAQFLSLLRTRFPSLEIRDLSPVLDELRLVKSTREIELIRQASKIAALGLIEAMRHTKEGVFEYELDAAARQVFLANGAKYEGYPSITAGGTNAYMGHYMSNGSRLKDGDLVLMDYAPDYRYYTSDVTRMWPVNGKYTKDQRALCEFILAYRNALLKRIRPGVTADEVMNGARAEMTPLVAALAVSKEIYREGARGMLAFRGHLSHPVGMTVHDVGDYRKAPLAVGQVFSIDPMMWIPEERLYVRMEDVVVVTAGGVENFTDFMPATPDDIEKVLRERTQ
ncbi:aminopeptidase P N-terminal domain-containing protein [Paludibaculum fermentans]|uniref:Xaa-Pro aminopeptidase n=1 Tax=Paludibaculum fermentans TaxID=1473598 RepID=A0A7S7SJ50_PALFE|nr:aminopeptidase P N-terminal domain-containing protein [Paludibaculum fermentans]QOY85615.1 aminopeptidase P N-terminal domain-containing protein [Paludibaculum fermentans]